MAGKTREEGQDAQNLSQAMRAIRKERRLRPSEMARLLDMPLRSYEHFEAGRGKISFDRIVRFAEATNSDPIALLAVLPLGKPEFALHCADNKLMTIMMLAMGELEDDLGGDIVFLNYCDVDRRVHAGGEGLGRECPQARHLCRTLARPARRALAGRAAGQGLAPQTAGLERDVKKVAIVAIGRGGLGPLRRAMRRACNELALIRPSSDLRQHRPEFRAESTMRAACVRRPLHCLFLGAAGLIILADQRDGSSNSALG